ncbi:MAG: hypothetical protein JWN76_2664 [Chitinophagaceae bacterium]|nr:hypothetical protein [Chitinophagaceae bacterium]
MKKISLALFAIFIIVSSCQLSNRNATKEDNQELAELFERYYNERMELFPLEATTNGDNSFNNKLYADFTDSYREKLKTFFNKYGVYLAQYDRDNLDKNDQLSYDIFKREMQMSIEGLSYHDNYFPANQFWGLPLTMGQLGSGESAQPFKTLADYENWLRRMYAYPVWTDSAIIYFRKGIESGWVLPKTLVIKMIPQLDAVASDSSDKNIFYGPVHKFSDNNSIITADKKRLAGAYADAVNNYIRPAYARLRDFLQNEYLPHARSSTGISALPGGDKYYNYLVRFWTTTNKTPEEIYQTGLTEVERIKTRMDSVKNSVNFKGDLPAFFAHLKTGKEFMPYKTPEEVLNAFHTIHHTMEANLKKMFGRTPKTKFEIRQTEPFRAASASAEYNQGTPDGTRPGIFYVPILDATKFNTTSGMESLFLHEAIPGHHYQISLQQENEKLPKFRRFAQYGAYVEGWALYCESLGKELGLFTDPYQYMGALGDEMHRAVRLVVDVAMHTKNMTREEAIKYMMENEPISEEGATAEIERYMAIPAQALSYKVGSLKIRELRNRYEQELGGKFKLSDFHDELLRDGAMPLEIMEGKMNEWAEKQKAR